MRALMKAFRGSSISVVIFLGSERRKQTTNIAERHGGDLLAGGPASQAPLARLETRTLAAPTALGPSFGPETCCGGSTGTVGGKEQESEARALREPSRSRGCKVPPAPRLTGLG